LLEAWIERRLGETGRASGSVRAGLLDLNADFDSIAPAALFENSSHGIAPDLSKSGRNGPSIFPVSALGLRLAWSPSERWTLAGAAFDGLSGDPDHPKAFAAIRLNPRDGALLIGQLDYHPTKAAQLSIGAWRYSAPLPTVADPTVAVRGHGGVYAFVEGPVPGLAGWSGWLRAGRADGAVQAVAGYLGAGLTRKGLIAGRPDDLLGVAVASAAAGGSARRLLGLNHTETTVELTYQAPVHAGLTVQPDIQYVRHPSSRGGIPDALAVGLRFVLSGRYPKVGGDGAAPPPDAAGP
jgi:porin